MSTKLHYRTLWISDVHLGNKDCHAEYLLAFLQRVHCDKLYLVGDIVDLKVMKSRVHWPKSHTEVMKQIYKMTEAGTEVIYVPGNHDMPMRYFNEGMLLGIKLYQNDVHTTRKGKKLLVVHGDEFDHAVLYRALNRIIGEQAYSTMVFFNRHLHKIRRLLGLPYWSLATFLKENVSQARRAIEDFEQAAITEAKQRGLDGVVCGHIHKAAFKNVDDVLYCNDGDWTESCTALVEHRDGELELLDWPHIHALIVGQSVVALADAA